MPTRSSPVARKLIMKMPSFLIPACGVAVLVSACAAPPPVDDAPQVRQGVIEQISSTEIQSSHHTGVGAVVGGVSGLALGSLVGRGSGRDVARVLGVVGGVVAGNELQKQYERPLQGQQIIVRTDSGVLLSVTQPTNASLRPLQRVYVQGVGENTRVIAQ